jgi:Ca-activated chloride channel family protein
VSARRTLALLAIAASSVAWLDPWQHAREGNRLYAEGKFEDATGKYNEALVDHPDSVPLHFNLGDSLYRQGKYDEALGAFGQVPTGDADPTRTARVAYNAGNAKYRLGEATEKTDPQKALGLYAEALVAYRRALGAAPEDPDAKFNHEFVEKKMADLKQKLEDEKKKQEQKQQDQQKQQQDKENQDQQDQQQQQQQNQDQQQQQQQQGQDQQQQADQSKQEQQQKEQQPEPTPGSKPDEPSAEQAAGAAGSEKTDDKMSKAEAAALLDAQRDQEVRPDEVTKRIQGAGVAEPAQDW